MVGKCIQCGAGATTITFLGRDVLRPLSVCACFACWRDMAHLATWRHEVGDSEAQVP